MYIFGTLKPTSHPALVMAPSHKHYLKHALHAVSPSQNQQNRPPSPTSDHPFPVLAIAVLSIMAAVFLLIGYYIFVNKCCHHRQQYVNLLRSLITGWRGRQDEDSFIALSPAMWTRGLDESIIRDIPTFQYRRSEGHYDEERSIYKCVVCLNEFQEQDMLRVLPKCSHAFHLDCIDIWFQSNDSCPLCRTSISGITRCPVDHRLIAPSSSPQGSHAFTDESQMGGDEDFVVIELAGEDEGFSTSLPCRQQESDNPREVQVQLRSYQQSPVKIEQNRPGKSKPRKCHHVSIMGDECIDVRGKGDHFSIQPIRRSFSLDSAVDQQLYLSVQEIIHQNTDHQKDISTTEETSNRVRRSFNPFGHGRISRKAVLPVEFEL